MKMSVSRVIPMRSGFEFFSYMAGTESSHDDPGECGEPYDLSCEVVEVVPPTAGEDTDSVIQLALQSFDMRSERVLDLCCQRGSRWHGTNGQSKSIGGSDEKAQAYMGQGGERHP